MSNDPAKQVVDWSKVVIQAIDGLNGCINCTSIVGKDFYRQYLYYWLVEIKEKFYKENNL